MMNKQTEALKMAIEALENCDGMCESMHHSKKDRHEFLEECPVVDRFVKAINACKEALESQEQSYQHKWDKSGERCVKCGDKDWMGGKCNVADSQEQEPVAWMGNYSNTSSLAFQKEALKDAKEIIPLYIHPAQPLSDDEINELWKESCEDVKGLDLGFTTQQHYFAWLIEQAHGIK